MGCPPPQVSKDNAVWSGSFSSSSLTYPRFSIINGASRSSHSESSDDVRGPYGLNFLYEPPKPLIDFVFVHGLRGGSRKTWSKSSDRHHFWPKEWLPEEPKFKNVRISSFGYNSDWRKRKNSNASVHDFGQALLSGLHTFLNTKTDSLNHPLVFVGHSMGGLVIKKMVLLSRQDPLYQGIAARVHSIFFLATPHRGADSAQLLDKMLKIAVGHGKKAYVECLIPHSDAGHVINEGFRHAYQGIQLWSFFETVPTSLGLVVEKDSAVLGLPGERIQLLNADHRNVCKFEDQRDSNYQTLRMAFIVTIDSIEKTMYSDNKANHEQEMRSLSSYFDVIGDPANDLANITDSQLEGSCGWLTANSSFLKWRSGLESPKVFWLTGNPATGKSTLSGHVVRNIQHTNSDCSYFFFGHHSGSQTGLADLLCSLAWQMASTNTSIRATLINMQKEGIILERSDERYVWRTVFLSRIFRVELRRPQFWIIDGIDECASFSTLIPLLARVDSRYPLLVFLTSRPSLNLERAFSREGIAICHELLSRERSLSDIESYIRAQAQYFPCESVDSREELVQLVLQRSNGNFLWTKLVVNDVQNAMSQQSIQDVLDSLPQELNELYGRIFEQLMSTPREVKIITCIFRWLICALRPLLLEELQDVLRMELCENFLQLEKTLSVLCGNLVYVDSQSRIWLAHATLREYLCRDRLSTNLSINEGQAHVEIAKVCLSYLQSDEMRMSRHRRPGFVTKQRKRLALSEYIVRRFSDHVAKASSSADPILVDLDNFVINASLSWVELVATSQNLTPLTATAKNIKTYLERRVRHHAPLESQFSRISQFASDLIYLVAQYGEAMLRSPSNIAHLVPPLCPTTSLIFKEFSDYYPRGLRLVGLSQAMWDDRLCCVDFAGMQALSVACRDNKYALGLSSGFVHVYNEISFREQVKLHHDEPVRQLEFATFSPFLASAGRRYLKVWNMSSSALVWTASLASLPLSIKFNENDTRLMAATRHNTLTTWQASTGEELAILQFSDIDEEDYSEYYYKRPPIRIRFAPNLNLLGVAYRQRPISFWELEDNSFIGQYHKADSTYPEPLIHDFVLNPNPDVCLGAVAYEGSDIAVFDPFTQHTVASADASASSMAASPDGSTLVTGSGDGTIRMFEFETLRLLYQVNAYQLDIRALGFSSNNLRVLDIRGNQFNIWEPSVLAYRQTIRDDSSFNATESACGEPEYIANATFDDDLTITAIAAHHDRKYLFCGKENGSLALHAASTGRELKSLRGHANNVALTKLAWDDRNNLLLAIDRAGGFSIQRIEKDYDKGFLQTTLLQRHGCRADQVLLDRAGDKLLVSTADTLELWNINGEVLLGSTETKKQSNQWWVQHPTKDDRLLLVCPRDTRVFEWSTLQECPKLERSEPTISEPSPGKDLRIVATSQDNYLCLFHAGSKSHSIAPQLHSCALTQTGDDHRQLGAFKSFDHVAGDIKCIIGIHKIRLLYLNHQGWVCSVNIEDASAEKIYARHFFIPLQWHSGIETPVFDVTTNGCIALAVRDEIAVFQNGLNFEGRVGCKGTLTTPKASMRSVMKRGVSEPGTSSVTERHQECAVADQRPEGSIDAEGAEPKKRQSFTD